MRGSIRSNILYPAGRAHKSVHAQKSVTDKTTIQQNYHCLIYDLILTSLALTDCIAYVKIDALTGGEYGAGQDPRWSSNPRITLTLNNGETLSAELTGRKDYNSHVVRELRFISSFVPFHFSCVTLQNIQRVSLDSTGSDGWLVAYIDTYIAGIDRVYTKLTSDHPLNKWVGIGYDTTSISLTMVETTDIDIPSCGYGSRVCECSRRASICTFFLEIDEIRTFTSYQKFGVGEDEGLFVRGKQGVIYNIDEGTGEGQSHPNHQGRTCATINNTQCTNPQFVDGKTFRMAIAVNGEIPGPTLIVNEGQKVIIHVHNNLSSEGISIHWHGMFQRGTPWMDGVGQVTQCQIGPSSSYSYMYTASPSGTFWYHSHSGAQRTDGFYGTLIVKENPQHYEEVISELGLGSFVDNPGEHSISLLDWQHEASLATFNQLNAGLGFFPELEVGEVPDSCAEQYRGAPSFDGGGTGTVPYFSGLINGKGRHAGVPYSKTRLSIFTVEKGQKYRFRLVGAQGLYAYKFSIDGHNLTVVNTDGFWIEPQEVDYVVIHTGERYDFILEANAEVKDYWIQAETLEIHRDSAGPPPYLSQGHVAEAILQYKRPGEEAPEISSLQYESIKRNSNARSCTADNRCKVVNCPFENFHPSYYTDCINIHQLSLLIPTPASEIPEAYPNCDNGCQHFVNFHFEGDSGTSSVNGRNFILPPVPPVTQNEDFQNQAVQCHLPEICNPSSLNCMCTQVLDIPYNKTVQLIFTSVGTFDISHPIHLHGHTFHVVKVGYPEYDESTGFIKKRMEGGTIHNEDIACDDRTFCPTVQTPGCNPDRCTSPRWANDTAPYMHIDSKTIRKDTVIVPAGGYVAINIISENPGYWFLHCHIEVHQLQGMAVIINEAFDEQKYLHIPRNLNKCGDFAMSMKEYENDLLTFIKHKLG